MPGIKTRVCYYWDDDVGAFAYTLQHPMKPHRIKMAHNLVVNYGLDRYMEILRPPRATAHMMTAFHTDEYIDFLQTVSPETADELTGNGQKFLIGEDCPAFEGVWDFCGISAGGSIACARRINQGEADIAINWAGGLHHAKKREASGFCYVNDIVLAILELLRYHARVLYIDIDIHHGDGVEEAFYSTDRVMTCSLHKFGDYFPGTGDLRDRGIGRGKGYAVNVPLQDGIDDETYQGLFEPIVQRIIEWYRPGAIVLQCGADSLSEDKLGCFNLSMHGHANCVRFVKKFDLPTIILGGGGYTIRNVARTWAYETGIAVDQELEVELPFNEYIEHFGPEFKLEVPRNNMTNLNTREMCDHIRAEVIEGLRNLPFAPGVAMRAVPPDPEDDWIDEELDADIRISQRQRDAHISRFGDMLSDSDNDLDQGSLSGMYHAANSTTDVSLMDMTTRGGRRRQRRKHFDDEDIDVAPSFAAAAALMNGVIPEGLRGTVEAPRRKRTFFRSSNAVAGTLAQTPTQSAFDAMMDREAIARPRLSSGMLSSMPRADSPGIGAGA